MNYQPGLAIGIDCGTSGIRAIALNAEESCVAQASQPLTQQSPQAWWQTTLAVLDELFDQLNSSLDLSRHPIAFSLDATSSSLLLINNQGEPISDVLMYYDARAESAQHIKPHLSANSGAQGAQSSLAKAFALSQLWIKQDTDWMVCHQADWLMLQLTGQLGISDENNCLKLGYDPVKREWEAAALNFIGNAHLPQVVEPGNIITELKSTLCQRWKLSQPVVVCAGTTDSIAAFLATGANRIGDASIALGSTLAFKMLSNQPYFDASQGIYSHRLGNQWLVGGASNAGGASLLEKFSLTRLEQLANQTPLADCPISDYYPLPQHCSSERFPHINLTQSQLILSDDLSESQRFACVVSGLVKIEALGWQRLSDSCQQPILRLFATGGGMKNSAWALLRETQLPYQHHQPKSDLAAWGAASLANKGLAQMASVQTT